MTGGDEGDAVLVAHVHGVLVAHGTAGMGDGFDAGLTRDLHGIAPSEREEGVRGENGALRLFARLFEGDANRVHAVGLAGAHAEKSTGGGDGDGVGLDVLDRAPGKLQGFELLWRGFDVRDGFKRNVLGHERVRGLLEPATADLSQALR